MPIEVVLKPTITEAERLELTRLARRVDEKLEKQQPLTNDDLLGIGTRMLEQIDAGLGDGSAALLDLYDQAVRGDTFVRLAIESDDRTVQALPWELAFHADERLRFLGRNERFSLLRRLGPADEELPPLLPMPLRILLFIASPEDLDPERSRLDFESEQSFLEERLDDAQSQGTVRLDVADDGSLETLVRHLETGAYHIVHITTHGSMTAGQPRLLLEDAATGRGRAVSPEELIAALCSAPHRPPAVVLSACQTATPDAARAVPSFAESLVEAGLCHVLGMRRSVGNEAATSFAGHLYHHLANGHPLDAAVRQARRALPESHPLVQWSIPVLYSRKRRLDCADTQAELKPEPRRLARRQRIGELTITSDGFIGRREVQRQCYRHWASGEQPFLLLYGIGGVGKTALAGHFALRLARDVTGMEIFAFQAPFDLAAMQEQVDDVFHQLASKEEIEKRDLLTDPVRRLLLMTRVIAERRPCLFIFDNLESCLDLATRTFPSDFAQVESLIAGTLRVPQNVRVLVTCRYPLESAPLAELAAHEVRDAMVGDVLRFMRQWPWPADVTAERKREIHQTFGGNFRSIEWLSALLTHQHPDWPKLRQKLTAGAGAAGDAPSAQQAHVLEAMRQNLLFDEVLAQLDDPQRQLLRRLALEVRPVPIDALAALWPGDMDALELAVEQFAVYRLVETALSPFTELPTYHVPPLVAELLAREPLADDERRQAHAALGRYWRHAGRYFTCLISDDYAALEHFTAAGQLDAADDVRRELSFHMERRQDYGQVVALLEDLVEHSGPDAPTWALGRLAYAYDVVGRLDDALSCLERARGTLATGTTPEERQQLGTVLNNISQIYKARGDYDQALEYLEQSLTISRQIGDRAGEGTTLNNISQIYKARGDYDQALEYLEQSLTIRRQIGDAAGAIATLHNRAHLHLQKQDLAGAARDFAEAYELALQTQNALGLFHVGRDFGNLLCQAGQKEQGLQLLHQSLAIARQAGIPGTDHVQSLIDRRSP